MTASTNGKKKVARVPPLYQADGRTYQADACRPVAEAAEAGQIRYEALSRGHYPGRPLGRKELPGVCLVGFWDVKHDQSWALDWHRNEGIELTFVETGSLAYACDRQEYVLTSGDFTIARPWQPHRVGDSGVTASRLHFLVLDVGVRRPHQAWRWPPWLVLTDRDRKEITDFMRHTERAVWPASPDVRRCFEQIGRAVETDCSGSRVSLLATHINELLIRTLEMFRCNRVRLDPSLASALRTVELFWAELAGNVERLGRSWTLKKMAWRCGMSSSQFIGLTRRLYNTTPNKYLNECRINQAARLLVEHPERTVTDIGLGVGFSSGQYFATVFSRQMRCSPLAFRSSWDSAGNPEGNLTARAQARILQANERRERGAHTDLLKADRETGVQ
jgi:AraC-like DNA-binding protein